MAFSTSGLKFTPPQLTHTKLLQRKHLTPLSEIMAKQSAVVLCQAPLGCGKSTLLCQYYAQCQASHTAATWLSIDRNDNHPIHFLDYIIAALQNIKSNIGRSIQHEINQKDEALTIKPLLLSLINELSLLKNSYFIFIDDWHLITNKHSQEVLHWLIKHSPPNMHFIIASRGKTYLDLAKLKTQERLIEYTSENICFDLEETLLLLNTVNKLNLENSLVKEIWHKTEGWVAALQLFSIAIKDVSNKPEFINNVFTTENVLTDYLNEVILAQDDSDAIDFLMQISIMDRFCAPVCDAIANQNNSQTLLMNTLNTGLFLIPLDKHNKWFRFNQLFSDYLRHQYQLIHPQKSQLTYKAISKWFAENGYAQEAIHYSLTAKDYTEAARLISSIYLEMNHTSDNIETLVHWIKALPYEYYQYDPTIKTAYIWALLFTQKYSKCQKKLCELLNHINIGDSEKNKLIAPQLLMLQIAFNNHTARYHECEKLCLNYIKEYGNLNTLYDAHSHLGYASTLSNLYQFESAEQHFIKACEGFYDNNNYHGYVCGSIIYSLCCLTQNKFNQAKNIIVNAFDMGERLNGTNSLKNILKIILSGIMHQQGEYKSSYMTFLSCIEHDPHCVRDYTIFEFTQQAFLTNAKFLLLSGNTELAINTLNAGEKTLKQRGLTHAFVQLNIEKILIYIKLDKLTEARKEIESLTSLDLTHNPSTDYLSKEYIQFIGIYLNYAFNELDSNDFNNIQLIKSSSSARKDYFFFTKIAILDILATERTNKTIAALEKLNQLLMTIFKENMISLIVEAGDPMETLLTKLVETSTTSSEVIKYIHVLLAKYNEYHAILQGELSADSTNNRKELLDNLSKRELEIVKLVAMGKSNKEISEILFIAISTLKTHLTRIFKKLEVKNRNGVIEKFSDDNSLSQMY